MNSLKPVPAAFALTCLAALAGHAHGQAIGPDCISSSHNDVARNGTNAAGTIIGYSVGSITCNHGDMPMAASPNGTIRPLMSQEMYRYKSYTAPGGGTYSRFEQIGQGWVKWIGIPVNGTSSTCGTCIGGGAGFMGVNCSDVYSSAFNGPGGMAKRSIINATTGYLSGTRGGGTAEANINTRLQVLASDVAGQPAGTRYYVESVHLLPHDAAYVRPGQTVAVNAMNNAASQEINLAGGTGTPALMGSGNQQVPAITRWRDLDSSVTLITADHDDTPNPDPNFPGTFIRSRFYVAAKVTALPAGQYRYEYAVYNLNSDRSGGAFTIPLPGGAAFTDFAFRHAPSHSGEAYSNAAWTTTRQGNSITFSTEKHADNTNANAIRWGSLYNFGFTTDVAPTTGLGTIALFKPGALGSIIAPAIPVPTVCVPDVNADDSLTADDVIAFLNAFFGTNLAVADIATLGGGPLPDGRLTADDLVFFLASFFAGCPQ
ncbi:MAG: GC-type dockerin domain-anchored protein [Phycisphaerales bacterium]